MDNNIIYKNSDNETEKLCEKLFPLIRQEIMKAYAIGYENGKRNNTRG